MKRKELNIHIDDNCGININYDNKKLSIIIDDGGVNSTKLEIINKKNILIQKKKQIKK